MKNFSLGLVKELKPRAMTRDIDWGVPVPVEGYPEDTKRIYVWFDAVIGYLSASVEWAHNRGTPDAWREWWQNPDAGHYYFMGKDNIVFHSVIWPAMLLGYGGGRRARRGHGRPAPPDERRRERVPDDGGQEGEHEPQPRDLGRRLPQPVRPRPAAVLPHRGGPETQDTDFTWDEFVRRNNDELLANWGNLVNRTLVSAHRNFGEVPEPGELTEADTRVLDGVAAAFDEVGAHIEGARFRAAIARGDARELAREPVRRGAAAVGARQDRSGAGRRRCSTSRCAASTR